jgi:hypothetical protein
MHSTSFTANEVWYLFKMTLTQGNFELNIYKMYSFGHETSQKYKHYYAET